MKKIACLLACLIPLAGIADNEITASIVLRVDAGFLSQQRAVNAQWSLATSPANAAGGTQVVPTNGTPALVSIGDVTTGGWSFFRNLSAHNTVSIGASPNAGTNVYEFVRLEAGQYALLPLGTSAVYAVTSVLATNGTGSVLERFILDR